MRPLRMTRDLRLLPRREIGIEALERDVRLAFEAADLVADRASLARGGERTQFLDLGVEFRNGLFEIEIGAHEKTLRPDMSRRRKLPARVGRGGVSDEAKGKARPMAALILGQRVQIAHKALQPVVEKMRIDLGGRDVGV